VNIMVAQDNGACGGATEEGGGAPAGTTGVLCRSARMLFQEVQVLFIDTSPIPLPGEAAAASAQTADGAAATPAQVNTGLITFQVPPAAAQLIASIPQDGFYLTLLPQTYTPQPIPAIDPNVALLPGEDAAQMTPYGPNGLPSDDTP
jgi:hypothetical protein